MVLLRSALIDGEHATRYIAIRILEMITPIKIIDPRIARHVPVPQEGKLLMKYTDIEPSHRQQVVQVRTLDPRPWTLSPYHTAHPIVQAILTGTNTESAA